MVYRREIRIVLIEPSHPGNIGGAARAMKTMGLDSLVLVNPTRFPDPQAEWRAAQAIDVVDAARVVDSLDEAIRDCGLVVGASTRERRIPWPRKTAGEIAVDIVTETSAQPVAILFGREASGLTNEELQRCRVHLQIPANPEYPSLNLAMAVQVVCYELFKAASATYGGSLQGGASQRGSLQGAAATSQDAPLGASSLGTGTWDRDLASASEMEAFYVHLEAVLGEIDFFDPKAPRQAMTRLRRMFGRIRADETEIGMLRGVLSHVQRAIRVASTGSK